MAQNHTTLSAVDDDVSIQTNVSAIIYPNDNENVEQIFGHFCNEMRILSNEIDQQYKKNQHAFSVVPNTEKTVVMQEQSSLIEKKTRIINKLTALIKDSKANDFPRFKSEATLSIPEMMERECNSMQEAFTSLEKTKENNAKYIEQLKHLVAFTEEMSQTRLESDKENELLEKIKREINKDSKQCKKELETVIETFFPDWNFMDVLRKLLENAATYGGWCEFETSIEYLCVSSLMELGVIEVNLSNMKQVKLKDLSFS